MGAMKSMNALDHLRAVVGDNPPEDGEYGYCLICVHVPVAGGAWNDRALHPDHHKPDCAWVAARRFLDTGETE